MSVINTNVNSLVTQNAVTRNDKAISTVMNTLSTGKRINSAKDDAAGLAISTKMTSQIRECTRLNSKSHIKPLLSEVHRVCTAWVMF